MRYKTVVEREGELLGPVDYSYDFTKHTGCWGGPDTWKVERMFRHIELLREAERLLAQGKTVWVRGGQFWHALLAIGMYDGWPFWEPTPALLVKGPLGGQWEFWYDLEEIELP